MKVSNIFGTLAILSVISLISPLCWLIPLEIQFDKQIGDHLELAVNATTIEGALLHTNTALEALEANDTTEGNTAVFFESPEGDIAYWYQNIVSARDGLEAVNDVGGFYVEFEALDHFTDKLKRGSETSYFVPEIDAHPYNKFTAYWCMISFAFFLCFIAVAIKTSPA